MTDLAGGLDIHTPKVRVLAIHDINQTFSQRAPTPVLGLDKEQIRYPGIDTLPKTDHTSDTRLLRLKYGPEGVSVVNALLSRQEIRKISIRTVSGGKGDLQIGNRRVIKDRVCRPGR